MAARVVARRMLSRLPYTLHSFAQFSPSGPATVSAPQRTAAVLSRLQRGFAAGPSSPPGPEEQRNGGPTPESPAAHSRPGRVEVEGGGSGQSGEGHATTTLLPPGGLLRTFIMTGQEFMGRFWVRIVQDGVDRSFDLEEFQAGATDAFLAVMEKFAARDIAGLEDLTSKPVREAFEGTWQQYESKGLVMKLRVTSVSAATVVGGGFLSDAQLMEVNEALPEVGHTVHGFKFTSTAFRELFLNIKVRFESVEVCEMRNKQTGAVQSLMEDKRGHTWHFARRVPHAMPVDSLEDPWRLVHIE